MSYNQKIIYPEGTSLEILDEPYVVTTDWTTVSYRIGTLNTEAVGVWVALTLNDSTGVSVRPVVSHRERSGDKYNVPTMEIHTGINKVFPKQYELQSTENSQKIVFQVTTADLLPYLEIQIKAETLGANPATIDSIVITISGRQ